MVPLISRKHPRNYQELSGIIRNYQILLELITLYRTWKTRNFLCLWIRFLAQAPEFTRLLLQSIEVPLISRKHPRNYQEFSGISRNYHELLELMPLYRTWRLVISFAYDSGSLLKHPSSHVYFCSPLRYLWLAESTLGIIRIIRNYQELSGIIGIFAVISHIKDL